MFSQVEEYIRAPVDMARFYRSGDYRMKVKQKYLKVAGQRGELAEGSTLEADYDGACDFFLDVDYASVVDEEDYVGIQEEEEKRRNIFDKL